MARPSNTAERRSQIVGALRQVMAESGYERASVASVARSAGLAPGLVHYHFGNKQEILLALIAELVAEQEARIEARLARAGDDVLARLDAYADAHLALGKDADPAAVACWVAIGAEAIRQPEVGEAYRRGLERLARPLAGLLKRALTAADRPRRRIKALQAAVQALLQGYFVLSAANPGAIPRGSAAPMARRAVRGLVLAETTGGAL